MQSELDRDIRTIIKWIFYLLMATGIYFALKFINEREITIDSVGEDLHENASKALSGGVVVGLNAVDTTAGLTEELLYKGMHMTNRAVRKQLDMKAKILQESIKEGLTPPPKEE